MHRPEKSFSARRRRQLAGWIPLRVEEFHDALAVVVLCAHRDRVDTILILDLDPSTTDAHTRPMCTRIVPSSFSITISLQTNRVDSRASTRAAPNSPCGTVIARIARPSARKSKG